MKKNYLTCLLSLCLAVTVRAQTVSADTLYRQAVAKTSAGDYNSATQLYLAAQKIAESTNNLKLLCKIQLGFGKIGLMSENNEAAKEALDKADNFCAACKDSASLARADLQRGVLLLKLKNYDEAIVCFKRSSDLLLLVSDTMGSANALAKVGNTLELQKRYAEAKTYYLAFYKEAQKQPESTIFLTANIYLTGNCHYLKQSQEALFYNTAAKKLAQKLGAQYEYGTTLQYDALIYEQMGLHKEAFSKLNDIYLPYYQDTLMNSERLQEAEELKTKYETEKKENMIALQTVQLDDERLRFWGVAAGLVLAILAGGLLFRLTRQLRKRNEEKEFLIKEIHHRVKNNLQILSSLLHLQSRQITDNTALDAVREGQSRVDAMGLIHQKLYMGDNVAKVEMKDYLKQFGQNMFDTFGIDDGRITMAYDMEPLLLDVDTAIPLGLIINELVTNALKYAFPENRTGIITVTLRKDDKNRLYLKVADDGVGAAAPDLKNSTSFGTSLVQMLSKKLKGKPEITVSEKGYATEIIFAG